MDNYTKTHKRVITKNEYRRKMLWAVFWFHIWTVWSFLRLPEVRKDNTMNTIFGWIVSQTGFMYMWNYEDMKDIEWEM